MVLWVSALHLNAECRVGVYRPSGFLTSGTSIVLVITNVGLERTFLSFDAPGPPFKFEARVRERTFELDRRFFVSPPITYGVALKQRVWLEPREMVAFYINLSTDLVLVEPPKLRSLRKLIRRDRAELTIECHFVSPGFHGCRFSLILNHGVIVEPPQAKYNVRKTLHWGYPTIVPMESLRPKVPVFDEDARPLFR